MKYCAMILAVLSMLFIAACAPVQPKPDPVKEELAVLQQQLLELQKLQNDTKARLDESTATIDALSVKINLLEERRVRTSASQAQLETGPTTTAPVKKAVEKKKKPAKKVKKKKKIRRQE